jgi:hypothetical protein
MIFLASSEHLARFCQRMAVITLSLMTVVLLLSIFCWFYPGPNSITAGYGLEFFLTDRLISASGVDVARLPWWQFFGVIVLSALPLMALISSLYALYRLFQLYGRREYFSSDAAVLLGKTGRGVMLWVILSLLSEPVLSLWLTLNGPGGQHMVSLSFTSSYAVALFFSAFITVIARILHQASEINAENQKFV